ncbi:MFS transporter [Paenibacillus sp. FSL K6-1217]|uniref:MFS transporter n=1 Tax=Paenibacillus sp. FSL K6-1217 TaxID=2921466 RepID=UPI003251CF69
MRVLKQLKVPRPVLSICLNTLVTHLGFYAMTAVLTVYLTQVKGMPLSVTAVVTMIFTVSYRSARFLTGPLLDNIDPFKCMWAGCFLTGVSLAMADFWQSPVLITIQLVIAGIGYSVRGLSSKASLSFVGSKDGHSLFYFANSNMYTNGAAIAGPLIGSLLLTGSLKSFTLSFVGGFYILGAILLSIFPPGCSLQGRERKPVSFWKGYQTVLLDKSFRKVLLFNMIGCFFFTQLFNSFPYLIGTYSDAPEKLGSLLMLNGILVVLFQIPIGRWMNTFLSGKREGYRLLLAFLLFGTSFSLNAIVDSIGGYYVFVALFTIAEMLFIPAIDAFVSNAAHPDLRITYFSVIGLSTALGEGIGVYTGLQLIHMWSLYGKLSYFWLSLALLSGLSLVLYVTLNRSPVHNKEEGKLWRY